MIKNESEIYLNDIENCYNYKEKKCCFIIIVNLLKLAKKF